MKIAIKNFLRNEDSNLTALSVKHFIPDAEIYLFNLNKGNINHDNLTINLYKDIIDIQTKYLLGQGFRSHNNGFYYAEGFNIIHNYFKDLDDKLLILDENHFFTNGNTLKEIQENDFDIAGGVWCSDNNETIMNNNNNASCICINPYKIKHLFPLPEIKEYIEDLLSNYLFIDNNLKYYIIKNRFFTNYFDDGMYTNDVNDMKNMMKINNII